MLKRWYYEKRLATLILKTGPGEEMRKTCAE
jgi:hypothetical protein